MRQILTAIRRFSRHPNGEHEQALIRIAVGLLMATYVFLYAIQAHTLAILFSSLALVAISSLGASGIILLHIDRHPRPNLIRKLFSILHDNGIITYVMIVLGEQGAPMYAVYLWVTFGNGFRFGRPYLYSSLFLSLLGFGVVLTSTAYWEKHFILGLGLWVGMAFISLYVSTLVTRLTNALNYAEAANNAKRRFISSVSHELRTPLNAISGMTNLIAGTSLTAEQEEMVRSMDNASQLMLSLIEDVLDFSKIEAGKLVIEHIHFDLHELVNRTLDIFHYQAVQRHINLLTQIEPDVPYQLCGDPHHLRQVFVNLLSNALKFTEKGQVVLRIQLIAEDAERAVLRFEIEDTGIGISIDAQNRIFESFTQADDSTTRRYGGTGLGTTICKQLIELMGGKLNLSSIPSKGTVFWFELAFAKNKLTHANPQIMGARILLIGFAKSLHADLFEMLENWLVRHESAPTIEAAIHQIEEASALAQPFGVVLLSDSTVLTARAAGNLPPLFLQTTVRTLQHAANGLKLPIILCGTEGWIGKNAKKIAEGAGISVLLSLPWNKRLLFNAIHSVMPVTESTEVVSLTQYYLNREKPSENYHVLIAEDNLTNRKVIQKILEREGHTCALAEDGEKALDILERQTFDAIILDMNMPLISGLEVAKVYLFMHAQEERSPLIMLSADVSAETKAECLAHGIDEFLPKPVQVTQLLETLDRLTAAFGKKTKPGATLSQPPPIYHSSALEQTAEQGLILNYNTLAELENIGQDPAFVDGLIEGYIEDSRTLLVQLERSLSLADFENFKDELHALKGCAMSIGAFYLKTECARLEKIPNINLLENKNATLEHLKFLTAQVETALVEYRQKRNALLVAQQVKTGK